MTTLSSYSDQDDLVINGQKTIEKFVKANYQKYTIFQLTRMLGVTPGVIQDILTDSQMRTAGKRAASSVIIVRDATTFLQDAEELKEFL